MEDPVKYTFKTEIITNFIKENNLTKTKFCQLCNIRLITYEKIFHNKFNIDLNDLVKIAKMIKIEISQLIN